MKTRILLVISSALAILAFLSWDLVLLIFVGLLGVLILAGAITIPLFLCKGSRLSSPMPEWKVKELPLVQYGSEGNMHERWPDNATATLR